LDNAYRADKNRKSTRAYKRRRNQLKQARKIGDAKSEETEGVHYQSGIGLSSEDGALPRLPPPAVKAKSKTRRPKTVFCVICEKGFVDNGGLKKHMKTHPV
jgi:hypothetical protein